MKKKMLACQTDDMNWILGTHAKVKQRTNTMLFPSGPRMHTVAHTIIMNKKQGLKINNVVHDAQPMDANEGTPRKFQGREKLFSY